MATINITQHPITIADCVNTQEAITEHLTKRFSNVGDIVFVPDGPIDNLSSILTQPRRSTEGRGTSDVPYKTVFVQWPFVYGYMTGEIPATVKLCDLLPLLEDKPSPKRQKCKASNPQTESIQSCEYIHACCAKEPRQWPGCFDSPFEHGTRPLQLPMIGKEKLKTVIQCYHLWFKRDKVARMTGELLNMDVKKLATDELEKMVEATYATWQKLTKEAIKRQK